MLFVDHPDEFHRILPGFLPRTLRPVEQGTQDPGGDSFAMTLREALFGPGKCPTLMAGERSESDPGDFWTSCFLVRRASVSQYDALRQVIATSQDLPGHVLCLALSGAGFHGQQERQWVADTGNLHLSVGLRCDLPAAEIGLALTMLPAVAVMDSLSVLTDSGSRPDGLGIKWVNDILVGGRKIGGVLTSARSLDGQIRSAVLGIGLNVAVAPAVPPTPFTPGVSCLEDCMSLPQDGLTRVLSLVLSALAGRFEELVQQGPDPLLEAYRADSVVLGRRVEIRPDGPFSGPHRQGRVLAIGPDLALALANDPEPVTSGRLVLLPE